MEMNETDRLKADMARLDALQNDGIPIRVCGRDIRMYAMPAFRASAIKTKLFSTISEKMSGNMTLGQQAELVENTITNAILEIFVDRDGNGQLTESDLSKLDDIDLRKIKATFLHLNEVSVKVLGELLAPVCRSLIDGITGAYSNLLRGFLENFSSSTQSRNGTDGLSTKSNA